MPVQWYRVRTPGRQSIKRLYIYLSTKCERRRATAPLVYPKGCFVEGRYRGAGNNPFHLLRASPPQYSANTLLFTDHSKVFLREVPL
jgi:hypothetical protein